MFYEHKKTQKMYSTQQERFSVVLVIPKTERQVKHKFEFSFGLKSLPTFDN